MKIELAPFYKKTLMEVRKIKYGQKVSYSMVAKIIGSENAVRAVGTANSKILYPSSFHATESFVPMGNLVDIVAGLKKVYTT